MKFFFVNEAFIASFFLSKLHQYKVYVIKLSFILHLYVTKFTDTACKLVSHVQNKTY